MYILDKNDKTPLYIQIYDRIKQDITENRLVKGEKLTSSRLLAKTMGISRNTVEFAYEKLVSEGLVINRARKGYYVEGAAVSAAEKEAAEAKRRPLYDMRSFGRIPPGFPVMKWKQCLAKAISDLSLFGIETENFGDDILKNEICKFLYKYRGISCTAADIYLFCGADNFPDIISSIAEKNFPQIGIENDSGFLFCGDEKTKPLRAKNENIIYVNTFSDLVFPAENIVYAVLPKQAGEKTEVLKRYTAKPDRVLCRALAYFMRDKNWERYLYRLSLEEKDKLEVMKSVCEEVFGRTDETDSFKGTAAIGGTSAALIARRAADHDILVDFEGDKLILGVRGMKKSDIDTAVRLLYEYGVKG